VPHGTRETARASIAALEGIGIGRYYLQEYRDLADIDGGSLATVFSILRS
jgi:hypothetical protein